jgi:hypothetical protein
LLITGETSIQEPALASMRRVSQLIYSESLFTLDAYRSHVFPQWRLDWKKIRHSLLNGTFNVFNFSTKEVKVIEPRSMS